MDTHAVDFALIERGADLDAGRDLLRSIVTSNGAGLCVRGPAGIGKTTLIDALVHEARAHGVIRVLRARGAILEQEFSFGVVRQWLEREIGALDTRTRRQLFRGPARFASAVLDVVDGSPPPNVSRETETFAVVHGLFWLCANLTAGQPLLLVLDDAHWSDVASLEFVSYAVKRLEGLPLGLLLTARDQVAEARRRLLLDSLSDAPGMRALPLSPLSPEGSARLLDRALDSVADPSLHEACFAATGGNPFLISELGRTLGAAGRPSSERASTIGHLRPEGVMRQMLIRLARVSELARALAQALVVVGEQSHPQMVAAFLSTSAENVLTAADELSAEGILVPDGLRFRHPLIESTISDDIPPLRRDEEHRRAARFMAARGATLERIATHLLEATGGAGDSWVVDTLMAAAEQAVERGAPSTAVALLGRALAEPPSADAKSLVLHHLGRAEAAVGSPEAMPHLLEAFRLAPDPRARAAVALTLAVELDRLGRWGESQRVCEEAGTELGAVDHEASLRLFAQRVTAARKTSEGMRAYETELLQLESTLSGATQGERMLLAHLAVTARLRGRPLADVAAIARLALAGDHLLREDAFLGTWWFAVVALWRSGLYSEGRLQYEHARQFAVLTGNEPAMVIALAYPRVMFDWETDLIAAEADARLALEIAEPHGADTPHTHSLAVIALALVLIRRGDPHGALGVLAAHRHARGERSDEILDQGMVLCRGLARLAGGDLDEGIRDLMAHGRFEDEQAGPDPAFCPWRSFVAPSLARAGRWQEARRLVEEEVTQARRQRIPHVLGIALEAAGLVIGGEQGIEHLQEALTWLDAPGSSYVRARTLLHLGSALRRANRRSECRATLVSALDLADRIGASGVARDARDELRIIGARPRRARSTGIESLSPSEYRVVRLACDGQTNRKIAQNLFVTVKTVEKQLASAFGKLGVESRVQLRALMGPESIAD